MPVTLHTIISDETVEHVVRSIMDNMPEAAQSYDCVNWKYKELDFRFVDYDTGKKHIVTKKMLLAAFPLLFTDKWPKGLLKPPHSNDADQWDDWLCQSDATSFDAFVQLAIEGEVIYG